MKYEERWGDFLKTINKLEEILKEPKSDIARDSAIKRFELCYELSWKIIKDFLYEQGVFCYFPRDCFKEAFAGGLIESDIKWIEMMKMRNLTIHTYKEQLAMDIFNKLPDHLALFQQLRDKLEEAQRDFG